MPEPVTYEKVSWTIQSDVLAVVRLRVPRGKVSAYVNDALRRQLEQDGLQELLDELVEKHGPPDEAEVARIATEWR